MEGVTTGDMAVKFYAAFVIMYGSAVLCFVFPITNNSRLHI